MLEELLKYLTIDNGLFIGIAFLGMLGHAIKKYLTGQLTGSVIDYFFYHNKKRTSLALLTTLGATLSLILGEQIPIQAGSFVVLAFTTGFTADSTINSDIT